MTPALQESPVDTRIDRPEFYQGDYEATFARLRDEDPLHWQPKSEMWIVTKHAHVREIASNPEVFSNGYGVTVGSHAIARQLWAAAERRDDSNRRWELAELRQHIGRRSSALPDLDNLQSLDPPAHGALRKIFVHSFTPAALRPLEDRVRELTRGVLDEISSGETGDFIDLLAAPVPIYVIAELLGVAKEDRDAFRRWSDVVISAVEPKSDEARAHDQAQLQEMFRYFRDQIALRPDHPQDDLLTMMVQAEVDGERLSSPVIETLAKLILSAGNETTRSSISFAAAALAQFPDERARLIESPALIDTAVNELLRWSTPVRTFCRTATVATEVGGRAIARGDFLALSFASANRDRAIWPDADRLDVTRKVQPNHLTFNHGPHVCIGQSLARLELKVVIEELLARFPDYGLLGEPEVTPSTMVNSIRRMPVVFR
jgi:cytochrome P450